jgi:hypothetical protein
LAYSRIIDRFSSCPVTNIAAIANKSAQIKVERNALPCMAALSEENTRAEPRMPSHAPEARKTLAVGSSPAILAAPLAPKRTNMKSPTQARKAIGRCLFGGFRNVPKSMKRKTAKREADSATESASKTWIPEVPEILVARRDRKSRTRRPPIARVVPVRIGKIP